MAVTVILLFLFVYNRIIEGEIVINAIVIVIISALLSMPISSDAYPGFTSPSLKDISEGKYYQGNYVVRFAPQKSTFNSKTIELFLLPEIVPYDHLENTYVLSYRDGYLKRFVIGDIIKINFRYEGSGNWSFSYFKVNAKPEEKGWVCCFDFKAFSLVRDFPFSLIDC